MLLYGLFATVAGLGEIILSFQKALQGSGADIIDILAWGIFLSLFWIAYKEKPIGESAFWKRFAPILIVADIVAIIFLTLNEPVTFTEGLMGIGLSIALSVPLYITIWWYAFTFLPSARKSRD